MAACLCIELLWEGRGVLADGYSSCFVRWKLSFFCSFLGSGLGGALGFVVLLLCFSALDSSWLCGPPRCFREELQKPGFMASALQERVLSPSPVLCRDHSILLLLLSLLFQSKAPLMRKKIKKSRALKVYWEDRSKRRRQLTLGKAPEKSSALFLTRD